MLMSNTDEEKDLEALMDRIIDDNLEALKELAQSAPGNEPMYHSYHRVIDDVR